MTTKRIAELIDEAMNLLPETATQFAMMRRYEATGTELQERIFACRAKLIEIKASLGPGGPKILG